MQLTLAQIGGAAHIIFIEGVAAVDDHIVSVEQVGQVCDGLLGGLAGRQHHPDCPGLFQLADQRS
ncbi:hypothetical protein D3C71_2088590 [compost metagenome]